jgi:hypothetical protein
MVSKAPLLSHLQLTSSKHFYTLLKSPLTRDYLSIDLLHPIKIFLLDIAQIINCLRIKCIHLSFCAVVALSKERIHQ